MTRIYIKSLELKNGVYYQVMANEGLWSEVMDKNATLLLINELLEDTNPSLCETDSKDCKVNKVNNLNNEFNDICKCGHTYLQHQYNSNNLKNCLFCHCKQFSKKSKSEHSQKDDQERRSADQTVSATLPGDIEPEELGDNGIRSDNAETSGSLKSTNEKCKEEFDKDYEKKA